MRAARDWTPVLRRGFAGELSKIECDGLDRIPSIPGETVQALLGRFADTHLHSHESMVTWRGTVASRRAGARMHFPVSGVETPFWLPPLVALVISFFTSMGGVSGAFLLLPFQVSYLGYTAPSVSATNQVFNVVAIPSGVYRYIREGRMVWPLTCGGGHRHPARRVHRRVDPHRPPARSQALQALRGPGPALHRACVCCSTR